MVLEAFGTSPIWICFLHFWATSDRQPFLGDNIHHSQAQLSPASFWGLDDLDVPGAREHWLHVRQSF